MKTQHLDRAIKQIELGKNITLVRDSLSLHFKEVDYQNWVETQRTAYYKLFPIDRVMTSAEKLANDTDVDGNPIVRDANYVYPMVTIDYSQDTNYVTLDEYMKEATVVTPAVSEVLATYDTNGVELTPYVPAIPAVTKLVREFVPKVDYSTDIDAYLANSKEHKERLKREKVETLDSLVITANTVLYDANGKSLGNMASVVSLANWNFNKLLSLGKTNAVAYKTVYKDTLVNWKGADNKIHTVQIESICEALNASMLEVAKTLGV